jgi:RNA polymerase sigma-70 factor, ECF subfamily
VDEQTIRSATAGDRTAQACLLRALQDVWFRVCLSVLGDRDLAAEATQECALRLLRDLPRFRGDSAFRTWAVGIAINVAREMRRKRGREDRGWKREDRDGSVGDDVEREEESSAVTEALVGLSGRQREAVVLRYFEEMSVEEAAKAMNCSPGTVKATVFQALRAMRKKLARVLL